MLLTELEAQIDINAVGNKLRRNAVHMAAYNGSDDILELLLDHGAKADVLDRRGHTALRLCYENWGIRASNDHNNEGFEKCLARLIDLDRQAAVEDPDLLSTATRKGSITILKHLLEQQPAADPNNRDQDGWTAVEIARQYRQPDAEKVLSDRGAVVGKYPSGWVTSSTKRISVDENGTSAAFVSETTGASEGKQRIQPCDIVRCFRSC
jgi:ankyrin repeat protein